MRARWLVAALVVAGCSSGGGAVTTTTAAAYPAEVRENFLETCGEGGQLDFDTCACLIDQLEATVPLDRFREIDAFLRGAPGSELPAEVEAAYEACAEATAGGS